MDENILKNITNFLGGGWLSVGIGVILIGLIIWWAFKKHAVLVDAAEKKTTEERDSTELREREKSIGQDTSDKEDRKSVDDFLGDSNDR